MLLPEGLIIKGVGAYIILRAMDAFIAVILGYIQKGE